MLLITLFFFFFLMIRRPPRSTLFPTRRSSDLGVREAGQERSRARNSAAATPMAAIAAPFTPTLSIHPTTNAAIGRSEEHTSELQSQSNLVCRLLLEKKKKKRTTTIKT